MSLGDERESDGVIPSENFKECNFVVYVPIRLMW